MFKTTEKQTQQPQNLKKKLMSALAMLLVATTLMTTTSYAWFVLSTAPEVTGITTNVGANGSLEIALLNAETYEDMSLIRAGAGTSMVSGNPAANNAWGNLVDLGYQEYGLSNLTLLPSRLMVSGSEGNYIVDTNLLAVPSYGFDGRVIELDTGTYSAIYQNGEFAFSSGKKDYGVRAIGTSDALSAQGSALASAKANIPAYIKNAGSAVRASLNDDLVGLVMKKSLGQDYNNGDLQVLDNTLTSLDSAMTTIDNTLRQGLIAYAASQIQSEDTFNTAKNQITNPDNSLSDLVSQMADVAPVPGTFNTWVTELGEMQNTLKSARIELDSLYALNSGTYTWEQIRGVMDYLLNMSGVYVGDRLFSDYSTDELAGMMGTGISMSLRPGAGIYADVADFVGNYSVSVKVMGTVDATMTTLSAVNPSYLNVLNTGADGNGGVQILTPADGGDEITVMPLDATYGYAIDLAFRCNAADPDLVLQTSAIQRVYTDSESGSTQGGGSYMAFTSADSSFTLDQMKALMDAIRVAFVNDQGGIMSVAKLNITNASVETEGTLKGMLKAPMYLYEYTFEPDENGDLLISFGERLKEENVITDLDQNVAKAVTAVVWLDGDLVDNTMVSAEAADSLNGIMNLQFATNAQLVPAHDDDVKDWTANADVMAALEAMMDPVDPESAESVYAEGQGTWTTASWNNFAVAYERAAALNAQAKPGEVQVRDAVKALSAAYLALTEVSKDAVNEQITQIRNEMGTTATVTGYIKTNVDGTTELVTEFEGNEEWIATATPVYGVDYANNNLDGEEGVKTPIYSDETWNELADALYNAELVAGKADATDAEVDEALTALETAKKALTYQVAFLPYEYKETIYYKTSYDGNAEDVYGDWYDSSFKRITSEVMMLTLDAYAEPAKFINVDGETYVSSETDRLTLDVSFLESVYPELRDAQVKGITWDLADSRLFTAMMSSNHHSILLDLIAKYADNEKVDTSAAEEIVDTYHVSTMWPTAAEAEAAIAALQAHAGASTDVVYGSDTTLTLLNNGNVGKTTVTATVLTTDGVVTTVSREIIVYEKADGIEVDAANVAVEAGGAGQKLNVSLKGGNETIDTITWATGDPTIATVSADGTVTGVAAGSTTVSVSVETKEGNPYVMENIPVTVTKAPETPAP